MTNQQYVQKAYENKLKLAKQYNVSPSSIVCIGDNKYIVQKDGTEIRTSINTKNGVKKC